MRVRTLFAPALAVLLMAGCDGLADLEVENLNAPDTRRVLATPGDVEGLIASSYLSWWRASHLWGGPVALSVAANAHSASWGNFGMKDFGTQPRIPIDNNPSYNYSYVMEDPWSFSYSALKAANDGLRAMDGADGGEGVKLDEAERARAFAKFVQGLSHGLIAMIYDQGFIFDETMGTDEIAAIELKPYSEVMDAAIAQLEASIAIAENADFTIPATWINGVEVTDEQLVRLAHSYIARYMAGVARSAEEAQGVAWDAVISHAQQGITQSFGPMGDGLNIWYDVLKAWGGVFSGWSRLDLRFMGMADTSGEYQAWLSQKPGDRQEFLINTPDRRVTGITPTSDGEYVQFYTNTPFRPERGTYFFSQYGDKRWTPDNECGDKTTVDDPDNNFADDPICESAAFNPYARTFVEQMTDFRPIELRLLMAEGHLRMGRNEQAAELINESRADWLPPVTAAGVPNSPDCVPHEPSATKACGDLLTALHWEKWLEIYHTGAAVEFADARRWGFLISGTPLHLPVPGEELQVLEMPIYTFGGEGKPGTAP